MSSYGHIKEEEWVNFYRASSANGMRKVAEMFKATNPDSYKFIREMAERTEKGEA